MKQAVKMFYFLDDFFSRLLEQQPSKRSTTFFKDTSRDSSWQPNL